MKVEAMFIRMPLLSTTIMAAITTIQIQILRLPTANSIAPAMICIGMTITPIECAAGPMDPI